MKKLILLTATFFFLLNISSAQPGMPDISFGIGGIIKADPGAYYNYSYLGNSGYKILPGDDGSLFNVIEANTQTFIIKRHPNGAIDSGYGNNGFSDIIGIAGQDALIQPDGKIILAGYINNNNYSSFAVARYNTDGSADNSFSNGGKQITDFGSSFSLANSVALQADGKIVVAGFADNDFAVARYNSNGSPDSSFSDDGRQTTDFNSEDDQGLSVAIQKDGRIVVGGFAWNGTDNDFALARYNPDGSPDSTFGKSGKQTTAFGGNDHAYSIAIQSNGKIILAGLAAFDTKSVLASARYNTNGSLDSSFGQEGKQTADYGASYTFSPSIVLQNDDKIIMTHYTRNGSNYDFAVSRYNSNGSLDYTFSGDGNQTTDFHGGDDFARSAAIQKDGKILLTGGANVKGSAADFALCRYNSDGTIDETFGNNGKLQGKLEQGYTVYSSTAIQKDRKIVTAGYTWNGNNFDFIISRYNTNGSPDNSFNDSGRQIISFGTGDDFANSMAIQDDGKIVVAGSASNQKNHDFAFVRLNPDGQPDKTFGGNGKLVLAFGPGEDYANALVIQKDGKIVAAGLSNDTSAIVRLNPDGSPDLTFSDDGKQTTDYGQGNSQDNAIALQPDGKIVVAGSVDYSDFIMARYNPDGSLDKTFADKGKRRGYFAYQATSANSIALQKDGKIVMAADVSPLEAVTGFAVARFTSDGIQDSTFGKDGFLIPDNILSYSKSVALQSDGKILVGGSLGTHSSVTRITNNGIVDSSFGDNGKEITQISAAGSIINSIAVVNDTLYAAGTAECPGNLGTVIKYLLAKKQIPPKVSLITPVSNAVYIAPAKIKLTAVATDTDGTIHKVEFYNGKNFLHKENFFPYDFIWDSVPAGDYTLTARATDNDGSTTVSEAVHISVIPNKAPIVSIIDPADQEDFTAPATIRLRAAARDPDGKIIKVRFYNGSILLRTKRKHPYTYLWKHVPAGSYVITAKATDDSGLVTTSAAVRISIVPDKAPVISIVSPANGESFTFPATIHLEAAAKDPDGRITNVRFYNGSRVLRTIRRTPYTMAWRHVPAGTYTLTAVATDDHGLKITSGAVMVTVTPTSTLMVQNRPALVNNKTNTNNVISVRLAPNPASNFVNIYTTGWQQNKQLAISVISASGVVLKTMRSTGLNQVFRLNISSLLSGTYTIKIESGDRALYAKFVKL